MILTKHITGTIKIIFKDGSNIEFWLSYKDDVIGIGPEVDEVTIEHIRSELGIETPDLTTIEYENKKIHSSTLFKILQEYLEDEIPEILKKDKVELNVSLKQLLDEIIKENQDKKEKK